MDFSKPDLLTAIGAVASPLLVAGVAAALTGDRFAVSVEALGGALAEAVCPERKYGPLGPKRLVGVEIVSGGDVAWLDALDAMLHPALGEWTPGTLGQAFALPVVAGYAHYNETIPNAPIIEMASVVVVEGCCSGQVSLRFPESGAIATVMYGQRMTGGNFASASYSLNGFALHDLGRQLQRRTVAAETALAALDAAERAALSQTVH